MNACFHFWIVLFVSSCNMEQKPLVYDSNMGMHVQDNVNIKFIYLFLEFLA